MAERRAVDAAGAHVQQIDQRQPQRAADDGGGAIAVGQRVEGGVGPDLEADRPVDDDQDGASAGAGGHAVQEELLLHHGLPRGRDDGKVHRQAAGHHGVDGELLGGDRLLAHRLDADAAGPAASRPTPGRPRPRPASAAPRAGRRSSRCCDTAPARPRNRRRRRLSEVSGGLIDSCIAPPATSKPPSRTAPPLQHGFKVLGTGRRGGGEDGAGRRSRRQSGKAAIASDRETNFGRSTESFAHMALIGSAGSYR